MNNDDKNNIDLKARCVVVTGGAGYIGSHVVHELLVAGFTPVVIDDLSTGNRENLPDGVAFFEADFKDKDIWEEIVQKYRPSAVMHLASSLDAVESMENPFAYLKNNTHKTLHLLDILEKHGINKLIFSSTAAVYGEQEIMPVAETATIAPVHPYGQSKLLAEELINYFTRFGNLQAVVLRYFNVAGSLPEVGSKPNSEAALLAQVALAVKNNQTLTIYGNDFNTPDGTAIRDFVHPADIARAHVAVLEKLLGNKEQELLKYEVFNIGSGTGYSVMQIVNAAEQASGKTIAKQIAPRRPADMPVSIADTSKIKTQLGFELKYSDLDTLLKSVLL